nr:response regulator transcription factor [Propionicimonas sp.]
MRVVIAEDSGLLRQALTGLLSEHGVDVVAAVGDGESLLDALATHDADACVVDVRMPPGFTDEGVRAALVIRKRWPDVGVLLLSQYVEERYAAELFTGGARGLGYLLKDTVTDAADFLDALRRVAAGGTALDPDVVAQLLVRTRHRSPIERLSPRERDVLDQMAQGRSNLGIATALGITTGAVEKHVTSIFTKLDLDPADGHRRVQAVLTYLGERP